MFDFAASPDTRKQEGGKKQEAGKAKEKAGVYGVWCEYEHAYKAAGSQQVRWRQRRRVSVRRRRMTISPLNQVPLKAVMAVTASPQPMSTPTQPQPPPPTPTPSPTHMRHNSLHRTSPQTTPPQNAETQVEDSAREDLSAALQQVLELRSELDGERRARGEEEAKARGRVPVGQHNTTNKPTPSTRRRLQLLSWQGRRQRRWDRRRQRSWRHR